MKHSLLAAACAAPPHGLLAAAALHAMATAQLDAKAVPALAPAATNLDTGQPLAIAYDAKAHGGKKHLRRDSAGPPIGYARNKVTRGVGKGLGGDYHRRREVALN